MRYNKQDNYKHKIVGQHPHETMYYHGKGRKVEWGECRICGFHRVNMEFIPKKRIEYDEKVNYRICMDCYVHIVHREPRKYEYMKPKIFRREQSEDDRLYSIYANEKIGKM